MTNEPTVFVVDDDQGVRKSLEFLAHSVGLNVESFGSTEEFLGSYQPEKSGCLVIDVRMPGTSGLDLHEQLIARGSPLPAIFLTAHGDVPLAVRAMKAGAIDFLEKPCHDQQLLDSIQRAIAQDVRRRHETCRRQQIERRLASLSPREREVKELLIAGKQTKQIAAELGIGEKTIAKHRARVLEKMQVQTVVELVRLLIALEGPVGSCNGK